MPIHVHADIRYQNQDDFAQIAYAVMNHVFAVHNEMGRFFDEDIYRDAVAARIGADAQTEVRIDVQFEDFRKKYYIDLLVGEGAVFELKSVRRLGVAQRSQLLNYLLLTELSHGKLVNFRLDLVEHEFVNTHLKRLDRTNFQVSERNWCELAPAERPLKDWLIALLRDVGAGLDVNLYQAAVSHFFGCEDTALHDVEILSGDHKLGHQKVRLAMPNWAFKVTTIGQADHPRFEDQARRFLQHTRLHGIQWINITRQKVTFTTIRRE